MASQEGVDAAKEATKTAEEVASRYDESVWDVHYRREIFNLLNLMLQWELAARKAALSVEEAHDDSCEHCSWGRASKDNKALFSDLISLCNTVHRASHMCYYERAIFSKKIQSYWDAYHQLTRELCAAAGEDSPDGEVCSELQKKINAFDRKMDELVENPHPFDCSTDSAKQK